MSVNLQESLITSLEALSTIQGMANIIKMLNKRKAMSYAEVYLFIFILVAIEHPEIMQHPAQESLKKVWDECVSHAAVEELIEILTLPENRWVKELYDFYVFKVYLRHDGVHL